MKRIFLQAEEANDLFLSYSRAATDEQQDGYDGPDPDRVLFVVTEPIALLDDIVRLPPHLLFQGKVKVDEDSRLERFNGEVLGDAAIHTPACLEFGPHTIFRNSLQAEGTRLSRFDCHVARDAFLNGMPTLREFGPHTEVGGTLWAAGASIERFDCPTGSANFENAQNLRELGPNARFNLRLPIIGNTPLADAIPSELEQFLEARKTVPTEAVLVAATPEILYWAAPSRVATPNPRIGEALRTISLLLDRRFVLRGTLSEDGERFSPTEVVSTPDQPKTAADCRTEFEKSCPTTKLPFP